MPIPAVVFGVIKVVGLAITAYEAYELSAAAAKEIAEFEGALEKAKEWLREEMKSIQETLNEKIDKAVEIGALYALQDNDVKQQSQQTKRPKKNKGRTFGGSAEIIAAIKQTIPFRKEIGNVCALAAQLPVIQLRKTDKNGVKLTPKEAIKLKSTLLKEVLLLTAEELDVLEDIEGFTLVRLKQLVVSRLFEFIDEMLGWASPLKAEACYGGAPNFADPKIESGTKLLRKGMKINPFWPTPQGKGSISADITLPDYRKEPLTKSNTFALIEIKFPGDSPGKHQFKDYEALSEACSRAKTNNTTKPKINGQECVTRGCCVALFRYSEDVAVEPKDDDKNKNQKGTGEGKQGGGKGSKKLLKVKKL